MTKPSKAFDFTIRQPTDAQIAHRHALFAAGQFTRDLLGVTQEQAAAELDVRINTLRAWEVGKAMPHADEWIRYRAWLLALFAAYVESEEQRPEPDHRLYVGHSVLRERLGLAGHCNRCLGKGHRAAHPDVRCKDVGCGGRH